jgi:hypothetical protein
MKSVEIIVLGTEKEYKEKYCELYAGKAWQFFDIPIIFEEASFDHIFSEPSSEGKNTFSERRAKRMLFMGAILSGEFSIEIMYELLDGKEIGNCALFCTDLECVMYLRLIPGKGMQVSTFFDFGRNHDKMYRKQKNKCTPIALEEIKQKITLTGKG